MEFNAEELEQMITSLGNINKLSSKTKAKRKKKISNEPQNNNQLSLFDSEDILDE